MSSLKETDSSTRPRVLLVDSNRWAVAARLASGFAKMGCDVAVLCPAPGHPAEKVTGLQRIFHYSGLRPLPSLRLAIESFDPEIVIPSCDRSVQHLHELHAEAVTADSRGASIVKLIERSLGSPEGFAVTSNRYLLIELARREGIPVPETHAIEDLEDLKRWSAECAPPWVIKADGTCGGRGVRIARNQAEAERLFTELTQRSSKAELVKRMMLNRDRDWVLSEWQRARPRLVTQSHIDGRPANCAVACWQGEVLAGIAVEVIAANGEQGPANIVEVVPGREMLSAARKIAGRLGITGFFGLDFMIEFSSGIPFLIEMNPRCTPPCSLSLGNGRDLVAAIAAKLTGRAELLLGQPVTKKTRIAYFPQAVLGQGDWSRTNDLESIYLDMPAGEAELVSELLHPRSDRSLAGRILDSLRSRFSTKPAPAAYVFEDTQKELAGTANRAPIL
jgi:predicted ATP-grasp superfamily ATP-dependent carboligase